MIPQDILDLLNNLTVFTLAILVGFAVISKVPATLHTPLMSGANSIHGIVLVGAMLIAAEVDDVAATCSRSSRSAFATMNVVGGYVVTDRMLQMFRKKPAAPKPAEADAEAGRPRWTPSPTSRSSSASSGSRAPSASSSASSG